MAGEMIEHHTNVGRFRQFSHPLQLDYIRRPDGKVPVELHDPLGYRL
jgi:hypothetical protein